MSSPVLDASGSVGHYELVAELARGGVGTVYLCRKSGEAGFQRLFALKVLHEHLAGEDEFVSMLLDEARIAAQVHHPNVVSILDLGSYARGYYVVMQYIEGCAFSQLLKRSKKERPPRLVLPIVIDTLAGLHAAHTLTDEDGNALELVHRDVSPQNILVGTDGLGRITDFGIAKAQARMTVTRPGVRKGKLAYMAPEQLLQEDEVDHRADIFSTGVVLWNALTGEHLFRADTEAGIIQNLIKAEIPKPSTVGLEPPAAFDAICMKALARNPKERFQTAEEMAMALREVGVQEGALGAASDVGAWVRDAFGSDLEARREAVRQARSKPRTARIVGSHLSMPDISGSFPQLSLTPASVSGMVNVEAPTPAGTPASLARRRRQTQMKIGAIAAAVVLALLIGLTLDDEPPESEPAQPVASSAPASAPAPEPEPAPDPATDEEDEEDAERTMAELREAARQAAREAALEAAREAQQAREAREAAQQQSEEESARRRRAIWSRRRAARAQADEPADSMMEEQPAQQPAKQTPSTSIESNPYFRRR